MFLEILKRDLKRKKTMNFIIFVFVIMSVTFICSSVTNLSGTLTSIDDFFESAGVGDFIAIERNGEEAAAKELAERLDCITELKTEQVLYNAEAIGIKTGESKMLADIVIISSIDRAIYRYFYGEDNAELTEVPKGGIYLRQGALETLESEVGDSITITIDGIKKEFKILGVLKDAVFGGVMMDTPRCLISEEDFQEFLKGENIDLYKGYLDSFRTDDPETLKKELSKITKIAFSAERSLLKITYMMEMIVAGILMIVSICLIIIALFILRFTISFTISEEFREIGIMKAIGIPENGIRMLYLIKYFVIAVLGALLGFFLSFPFSNMLLEKTRKTIIISDEGSLVLSVISAIVVIAIVMLFSFRSTRLIKKFTPVDAIRNGSTGERYKKKGLLRLSKSGARPTGFMAANDILSGFGKYAVMLIIFTIGILLVMIVLNVSNTLKSGKIVKWLAVTENDVYLVSSKNITDYHLGDGKEKLKAELEDIEKTLSDNGMPCRTNAEVMFKLSIENGDKVASSLTFIGVNTDTSEYENYIDGSAPQNKNEISVHYMLLDKIGAKIGDKVKVMDLEGSKEYIITGTFETMTNMGEGIRLHQDDDPNYDYMNGIWGLGIRFTDNPSEAEKNRRMESIKKLLPDYNVMTPGGFVDKTIHVSSYLDDTIWIILLVVIFINILVAVLIEKSFLTRERGEIAMLKAIGFNNLNIILWQELRILIVMIMATVISMLFNNPICQVSAGAIFRMMGAKKIIFDPSIIDSYVIYPAIIIVTTLFGVFLTTLSVRKISSNEINSIE